MILIDFEPANVIEKKVWCFPTRHTSYNITTKRIVIGNHGEFLDHGNSQNGRLGEFWQSGIMKIQNNSKKSVKKSTAKSKIMS